MGVDWLTFRSEGGAALVLFVCVWRIYIQKFPAPLPQQDQILLFLHMFSPKSACVRGAPSNEGWRPPPPKREILDPPLNVMSDFSGARRVSEGRLNSDELTCRRLFSFQLILVKFIRSTEMRLHHQAAISHKRNQYTELIHKACLIEYSSVSMHQDYFYYWFQTDGCGFLELILVGL